MYYQSASSGTSAVKVPRRRGYDPGQDSIYQSQQTPELATSPSADAPNSTAPWNFEEQFRPFQQKISSFLASAQTAIATSKLEDSGRSNKKKQKRLDVLLCAAAVSGDLSLINNLLDAGADPLSASSGGVSSSKQTALHWAAAGRQFAAFLTLQHCLEQRMGANPVPTMINSFSVTPFDLLSSDLHSSRLQALESKASGPSIVDDNVSDDGSDTETENATAAESFAWVSEAWSRTSYLFSSGQSPNGTLGRGERGGSSWPKRVTASLGSGSVRSIACSAYVSACVLQDGALFTWGLGTADRLGHFDRPSSLNEPRRLSDPSSLVTFAQVALSANHGAALTTDGALYTWGRGTDGQLGYGASEAAEAASSVTEVSTHVCEFSSPMTRVKALRSEFIRAVFCAERHTVAVTNSGRVYTFGQGSTGALGHGPPGKDEPSPRLVNSLLNTSVQGSLVAVGPRHTCIVTTSRDIYLFGFGNPTPRRIQFSFGYPSLSKSGFSVASVASCASSPSRHAPNSVSDEILILSDSGELFSYLEGVDACPITIAAANSIAGQKLIRVFSGDDANYALSASGALFKFRPRTPTNLSPSSLDRIPLIQRVEDVCASRSHCLYRVKGPLSPPPVPVTTFDTDTDVMITEMLTLLRSERDFDVILQASSQLKTAPGSPTSAGIRAHSWILSRIPSIAKALKSAQVPPKSSVVVLSIPVSSEVALRVWIQWVYTESVWTTRSIKESTISAESIALFRHEQHLKPLLELSSVLNIPSFARTLNSTVSTSTAKDVVPLFAHLKRQFVSPLPNYPKPSVDRSSCVEITLSEEGSADVSVAYAHRCMLSLRSDYFGTMLDGNWSEAGSQKMHLTAVSPTAFHLLLSYIYSNQLFASEEEKADLWNAQIAFELLALSDELLIPTLASCVEKYLMELLKPDAAARLYQVGATYRAAELQQSVARYISLNAEVLLRLNVLAELNEVPEVLVPLQRESEALWARLPMSHFSGADATFLLRAIGDIAKSQPQSGSLEREKAPRPSSPSSVPKPALPATSPQSQAPSSPIATSPPVPTSPNFNVASSPSASPSPWAPVGSDAPKLSMSQILEQEKAQSQKAAVAKSWSPTPKANPSSPSPQKGGHWAGSESGPVAWPSLAAAPAPTPTPNLPKSPPLAHSQPKKRRNQITIAWGESQSKPRAPVVAPWQSSTVNPAPSPKVPATAPKKGIVAAQPDTAFPSLAEAKAAPALPKPSLKEIIDEQQKQTELLAQKARPLSEILAEEALLAEHIRVEKYYETLKNQKSPPKPENPTSSESKSQPQPQRQQQSNKRQQPAKSAGAAPRGTPSGGQKPSKPSGGNQANTKPSYRAKQGSADSAGPT